MRRRLDVRRSRVALYGSGEAAELAYLCLRELGLEPVAVFDRETRGEFLGMPVQAIDRHRAVAYDLMIVATMADPAPLLEVLRRHGVADERIVPLREGPPR